MKVESSGKVLLPSHGGMFQSQKKPHLWLLNEIWSRNSASSGFFWRKFLLLLLNLVLHWRGKTEPSLAYGSRIYKNNKQEFCFVLFFFHYCDEPKFNTGKMKHQNQQKEGFCWLKACSLPKGPHNHRQIKKFWYFHTGWISSGPQIELLHRELLASHMFVFAAWTA